MNQNSPLIIGLHDSLSSFTDEELVQHAARAKTEANNLFHPSVVLTEDSGSRALIDMRDVARIHELTEIRNRIKCELTRRYTQRETLQTVVKTLVRSCHSLSLEPSASSSGSFTYRMHFSPRLVNLSVNETIKAGVTEILRGNLDLAPFLK